MGRSAGAGSPVWFRCHACRSTLVNDRSSTYELTGRTKPYKRSKYSMLGSRSTTTAYEYRCSCGHVGWSNHIDLARKAASAAAAGGITGA